MPKKSLQFYVFWLKYRFQYRGIAKLVRHQVLILASVGSSPATPVTVRTIPILGDFVNVKCLEQRRFYDKIFTT